MAAIDTATLNAPLATPLDIKLMNVMSSLMLTGVVLLLIAAFLWWLVRLPVFALAGITVRGDVEHHNAVTVRANVAPKLQGNFFTLDLNQARHVFEGLPWVRHALVQREFPNRLRVVLQAHSPVAYWGAEGEGRLINSQGEVFEANPGDVDQDDLPRLSGPREQSSQVLATYRALAPLFRSLEMEIEQLTLTARGSRQARLDTGAMVELGRGSPEDITARVQRFAHTLTQATSRYGRRPEALVSADLRHADGYAIRLRGVSTLGNDVQKK